MYNLVYSGLAQASYHGITTRRHQFRRSSLRIRSYPSRVAFPGFTSFQFAQVDVHGRIHPIGGEELRRIPLRRVDPVLQENADGRRDGLYRRLCVEWRYLHI